MNETFSSIGRLFELSRDAVIGIENGTICFANPPARQFLHAVEGMRAADVVPDYILEDGAPGFLATVTIGETATNVSVTNEGDRTLLCYNVDSAMQERSVPSETVRVFSEALSSLRLAVDAVVGSRSSEDNASLRGYTAILYRDYYQLKRLCNHLSVVANLNEGSLPWSPRTVDLEKLLRSLCASVSFHTDELGLSLLFQCSGASYYTQADPDLLENMLLNLITNGILRCDKGGSIRIRLTRLASRIVLSVDSDGPAAGGSAMLGTAETRLRELNDDAVGAGLGLSIVRGIVERHGGALILENAPEKGLSVRVSLPVTEPDELTLSRPELAYGGDSQTNILTELSVVLPAVCYEPQPNDR